jgi:hypothetical protein
MFNIDFIIGCNADELKEVVQLVEYAQAIDLPLSSSRLLLTMDGIQLQNDLFDITLEVIADYIVLAHNGTYSSTTKRTLKDLMTLVRGGTRGGTKC